MSEGWSTPCGPLAYSGTRPAGGGGAGPVPPIQTFRVWQTGTVPDLLSALVAGEDIARLVNGSGQRIVEGIYRTTNGVGVAKLPTVDLRWDRCTRTFLGIIAGVTDPQTFTLAVGHNLPASGTGRAWNIATATNLGDVGFTVVGNTLSLAAPRPGLIVGDFFYGLQPTLGATGEFDINDGPGNGDIQPQPYSRVWFDGVGLRHTNDPLNQTRRAIVHALILPSEVFVIGTPLVTTEYTNGFQSANIFNQFVGWGYQNSTHYFAGGLRDGGGGNRGNGMKRGTIGAPTLVGGNNVTLELYTDGYMAVRSFANNPQAGIPRILTAGGTFSENPTVAQAGWASTTNQPATDYNHYDRLAFEITMGAADGDFTYTRTNLEIMLRP